MSFFCCDMEMVKVGHIDIPGFYFLNKSIIAVDLYLCKKCNQIKFKFAPPREETNFVTIPDDWNELYVTALEDRVTKVEDKMTEAETFAKINVKCPMCGYDFPTLESDIE